MNNEFKTKKFKDATVYVLESATSGGTSAGSVASVPGGIGGVQRRKPGQNLIAQEGDKAKESKPRNFVAKNAKMGGAGAHKDKKKAEKQGDVKHKARELDMAEGLPQTLRKVVPGYAKREIDKKMDAGKFGKTDADKDANFQRYKKIQDKLKEQGVAEAGSPAQQAAIAIAKKKKAGVNEGTQVVTGKGAYVAKRVEALKKMGYKVEKSHTHPNGDVTVRLVDGVAESLGDDFAAMAKARGFNVRKVGTPDQERQRTQDMIAQRKQAETEKLKGVDLAALQAKYDEMSKQYQALGGNNWQYADREQNLTPSEREARSMESDMRRLSQYIYNVKQAQGVAEDQSTATGGWGQGAYNTLSKDTSRWTGDGHSDAISENPEWYNDEANSMTTSQLKSLVKHAAKLRHAVKAMQAQGDTLEPWQQSKVTKAADYLDAVFNAVDDEHDMGESEDHPDEKEDKALIRKMVKQQALKQEDSYMEALSAKLGEKLKANDPVDKYIDDFSKAAKTPNAKGHHQFKNKSPEKVRQMAIAASYGAKNKSKKK